MRNIDLVEAPGIREVVSSDPLLPKKSLLEALRWHYNKEIVQPPKQYIRRNSKVDIIDRIISMPVYIDNDSNIAGIKWIGSHSKNYLKGMQRANALIILNDPETNAPIAILDGSQISTERTFAMTLLGMDAIYPNPKIIACIGLGKLGKIHAEKLPGLYSSIEKINCFSHSAEAPDLPCVQHCKTLDEALSNADVVITTTSATGAYIGYEKIKHCKLVINLSVMDFLPEVYAKADNLIIDDWEECYKAKSAFTQAVDLGMINKDNVNTLGECLFSKVSLKAGLTMFSPLGMAVADIILANKIYSQLLLDTEKLSQMQVE